MKGLKIGKNAFSNYVLELNLASISALVFPTFSKKVKITAPYCTCTCGGGGSEGLPAGLRSRNQNQSEPYSFGVSGTGTVFGIQFRFRVQDNVAKNKKKIQLRLIKKTF